MYVRSRGFATNLFLGVVIIRWRLNMDSYARALPVFYSFDRVVRRQDRVREISVVNERVIGSGSDTQTRPARIASPILLSTR